MKYLQEVPMGQKNKLEETHTLSKNTKKILGGAFLMLMLTLSSGCSGIIDTKQTPVPTLNPEVPTIDPWEVFPEQTPTPTWPAIPQGGSTY